MRIPAAICLLTISSNSYALPLGNCANQLQEEANVFEVNCTIEPLDACGVTGYFTHPKLIPGYRGLVATVQKPPKDAAKGSLLKPLLLTYAFRNGEPKVKTPLGYFSAVQAAERIMLGEIPNSLMYFDAISGAPTPRPRIECEPTK